MRFFWQHRLDLLCVTHQCITRHTAMHHQAESACLMSALAKMAPLENPPSELGPYFASHLNAPPASLHHTSHSSTSQGSKCLSDERASQVGSYGNIHMSGSDVFKFAVRSVPTVWSWGQGICGRGMRTCYSCTACPALLRECCCWADTGFAPFAVVCN